MDTTTATWVGIGGIVSGALAALYTYMKHSKCKAHCCGKTVDMEVDLTPVVAVQEEKPSPDQKV